MKVTKEKNGDVLNIAIEGEVNVATAPQLKEDLEGEVDGVEVV